MRTETTAIHAGHQVDIGSGAVVDPITLSVTYERDSLDGYSSGYFYTTAGNPNRAALEAKMKSLEGAEDAVAFATGSMAITTTMRAVLSPGDHVIVPMDVFQGTVRLLRDVLAHWGISWTPTDLTDLQKVQAEFDQNTKLVWTEALSNPQLKVSDVEALAVLAHEHEAVLAVDNTFVTPIFQRPLSIGADLVIHASTKYLGGHGDVAGGVVAVKAPGPLLDNMRLLQRREGGVPSPFDCWLVNRGIKTLPYRMRGHADNALEVARFLNGHPKVDLVHYPGLESHPQHDLARRVLAGGFGGIVSFHVKGGREKALQVADRVRIFTHATSLGQTESLLQHQASSPTQGPDTGLADDLLRLSVGLEHPDDLADDLDRALNGK